ncbi:MAG: hypothetical protein M9936_15200 [Caldilinea sp.]|nr:hypothetical protein [Caldilinea sp.]MCB0057036.1 hypothetical protein [Caldilineaceae bacterium]MCB0051531.1 hypothetical protein [Caldilinea sp.]MCB0136666.1 hypothetical protein [Caldilineaceae bacterium]MCB0148522.1 hypothetical protein [Caldilineaceae bacterium]
MKAFTVMGRTIKGAYEEFFLVVGLSLVFWAGTLLVVTAPMTWVGMNYVGNRIANYRRVNFSFFWEGAKQHIGRGVLLWLLIVLAPPIMISSVNFYLSNGSWMVVLGFVTFWLLVLAFLAGQYFYPLFWQQTEPTIGLILRNGFLLSLRHPLYSFLMLLFQVLLIVLSVLLVVPVLLLLPGLLILSHNYALVGLLQEMDLAAEPPEMSGT